MNNNNDDGFIVLLFLLFIAVGAWGIRSHFALNNSESHEDIVLHGAAHWEVQTDGTTTFVWNTEVEEQ